MANSLTHILFIIDAVGKPERTSTPSDLLQVEEHARYVQDSLHRLLGIGTVLGPVRQVFVKSHLPSNSRILQLRDREDSSGNIR